MMAQTADKAAFARALKVARQRAGISQGELARRTGYTRAMVSLWEKGESAPSGVGLMSISAALGVRPETLLSPRKPLKRR